MKVDFRVGLYSVWRLRGLLLEVFIVLVATCRGIAWPLRGFETVFSGFGAGFLGFSEFLGFVFGISRSLFWISRYSRLLFCSGV